MPPAFFAAFIAARFRHAAISPTPPPVFASQTLRFQLTEDSFLLPFTLSD
jgi:hypothetical protein